MTFLLVCKRALRGARPEFKQKIDQRNLFIYIIFLKLSSLIYTFNFVKTFISLKWKMHLIIIWEKLGNRNLIPIYLGF